MSNLCDDQVIQDNNYTNTYSLWGNSQYYDIKNLSPQNYCVRNAGTSDPIQEVKVPRWSASPSDAKPPEYEDSENPRTIRRDSLFHAPESCKDDDQETPTKSPSQSPSKSLDENPTQETTNEWTTDYWHKASEKLEDSAQGPSGRHKKGVFGLNKIQKKIDKMVAKPVKMTKAESMMQKMGWQGGALGRSGEGIVEPIAPNAVYAKKKFGFGQQHIQLIKPPKPKKPDIKHFFEMNVLENIYEFVKNNGEVEMLFDRKLKKGERKQIHNIVQFKLKADDLAEVGFESTAHLELVLQISDKCCYVLQTQSYGAEPYRQLCIYKEAPPHVFLVIPDDLRDDEEDEPIKETPSVPKPEEKPAIEDKPEMEVKPQIEEKVEIVEEPKEAVEKTQEVEVDVETEEDSNPFLRSITRNLKKPKLDSECQETEEVPIIEEVKELPPVPPPIAPEIAPADPSPPKLILPEMSISLSRIVDYFLEFAGKKQYTQFKFLGPFTEEEINAINDFLEQAMKYLSNEAECPLAQVFEKVAFDINDDCTGNTVIYKKIPPKKERKKSSKKPASFMEPLMLSTGEILE